MTSVINGAHQKSTRVVLTLQKFAWTSSQASAQAALLGNPAARTNLARQAAAAVRDRGADGINLDFEPIASGYADEFTLLVREVRAELNAIALGYQLTFDTTGHIGNYPIEDATAPGGADAIFIMGYDYRTAGATYAGSISPLAGPAYDLTDTLAAYTARVPAAKLILGLPYYGRAWSTVSDALNARNQSGTKFGASSTVLYETAVTLAGQHGRRYDPTEQSPWFAYKRQNCTAAYGCVTSWREVYYDDPQSLGTKYDLINRQNLRGAGIWALGYDGTRTELYQTLASKFTGAISGGATVTRLAGPDRFATAAAISQAHFGPGVPVVYITNGLNFPDALAGGPAAAVGKGPILPVKADAIPASIAAELVRLNPGRIVVLGGPVMVSNVTAANLQAFLP
jgi:spore germination protein YaaH